MPIVVQPWFAQVVYKNHNLFSCAQFVNAEKEFYKWIFLLNNVDGREDQKKLHHVFVALKKANVTILTKDLYEEVGHGGE